jgi:hypothetical protein
VESERQLLRFKVVNQAPREAHCRAAHVMHERRVGWLQRGRVTDKSLWNYQQVDIRCGAVVVKGQERLAVLDNIRNVLAVQNAQEVML